MTIDVPSHSDYILKLQDVSRHDVRRVSVKAPTSVSSAWLASQYQRVSS